MPTISSVIDELATAGLRIERSVRIAVTRTGADLTSRFRTGSPVSAGALQAGWRLGRAKSSTGVIASVSITNKEPHAIAVEEGVDPSSPHHPWALSMRKDKKASKGNSKIVLKSGRIWSSSAVGGVSGSNISNAVVRGLARDVANSIISALPKKK